VLLTNTVFNLSLKPITEKDIKQVITLPYTLCNLAISIANLIYVNDFYSASRWSLRAKSQNKL